jgi:hypothetical protein
MQEACIEKMKGNPEEMKSVTKHQLLLKEEVTVGTIGALQDQYEVWLLTVRHRGWLKKWTLGDGGSCQKVATAHGWLIRCAVPAKGHGRRGPHKTPSNEFGGRSWRQKVCLGSKETFYEALVQNIEMEIVKLGVGLSIGLPKMSDWTLWRSQSHPKGRRDY